jgi:hypothetical protein
MFQPATMKGDPMFAAEFGTGQVFWSMLWFTMFFIWVWLLIDIFASIFRSPDLSGWGKAAWTFFVIVLPFLGVFTYLIARGKKMSEQAMDEANRQQNQLRSYVQGVVAETPNGTNQLVTLASMHDSGVITDEEFKRMKSQVMASA